MNRSFAYALGPELVWALILGVAWLFAARNSPPTNEGNARLETILWILPAMGVLLSFAPLAWTPGNQWWLLLRIVVCGGIGLFLVIAHLCAAIDYRDSRNSGVGSAFMLFIALDYMLLMLGSAIVAVVFLVKGLSHRF